MNSQQLLLLSKLDKKQKLQVLFRLLGKEDPFQNPKFQEKDLKEQELGLEEEGQEESPLNQLRDSEEDRSMESPSETEEE